MASFRLSSGIEPRFGPRLIRPVAAEFDAVVQAERTVVPEFDPSGAMRQPLQRGGRGTSPMAYLSGEFATAFSKAKRLSSGCDCLLAQAPIWPAAVGWRNRRRPPHRSLASPCRGPAPAAAAISSGTVTRPWDWRPVRGPFGSRCGCRRRSLASKPLSSTMRTSGRPSASTVASAIAFGSLGSAFTASANQSPNSRERLLRRGEITGC